VSCNNLQECQKGVGQRQQVPREWFTLLYCSCIYIISTVCPHVSRHKITQRKQLLYISCSRTNNMLQYNRCTMVQKLDSKKLRIDNKNM